MYKKINLYVNGEYVCTTASFRNQAEWKKRLRSDKRVFVHGMPERVVDICDYDKIKMEYAE